MTSGYLERRRDRVAAAWSLTHEVVLVGAGGPIPIPGGADQTFPFIAHSDYFFLADREVPGGVVAYDPGEGWIDFVPEVTTAERVWEGKLDEPGRKVGELAAWIAERRGRPVAVLGCPIPGVTATVSAERAADLQESLMESRRPKDEHELRQMRAAAAATAPGYAVAREMIRAGVTERALQVELETAFFRAGATGTGYGTIVAVGSNSAVLHFMPTSRAIRDGDVVLIDAGAAVGRYVSDVTRTYRAAGGDDGFYRELYALVLSVEENAIRRSTAGREWRDVHLAAAVEIAAGLASLGIMKGNGESLVEADAHTLFFPHGLGHMVGLGVRDAGGRARGREPLTRPGLSKLRSDLPLRPGYAMTVEPGIYFIPALLNDPENRARYRDTVAWDRVERLLDFGGIRIEDNVVITDGEPEVLTASIPK